MTYFRIINKSAILELLYDYRSQSHHLVQQIKLLIKAFLLLHLFIITAKWQLSNFYVISLMGQFQAHFANEKV